MSGLGYETIVADVRARIVSETKAKLAARRAFLEGTIAEADAAMSRLDNERLGHFLAKHVAAAELRALSATETELQETP
jgi:hypothetical protein